MIHATQNQHHPFTRQRRAGDAAQLQTLRLGLPPGAAEEAARDTARRIRHGTSAAMAIYLAVRAQRDRFAAGAKA